MSNQDVNQLEGIPLLSIFDHPSYPSKLKMVINKILFEKEEKLDEIRDRLGGSRKHHLGRDLKLKRDTLDGLIDLGFMQTALGNTSLDSLDSVKMVKEYLLIRKKMSNLTSNLRNTICILVENAIEEVYQLILAERTKMEENTVVRSTTKKAPRAKIKKKPEQDINPEY